MAVDLIIEGPMTEFERKVVEDYHANHRSFYSYGPKTPTHSADMSLTKRHRLSFPYVKKTESATDATKLSDVFSQFLKNQQIAEERETKRFFIGIALSVVGIIVGIVVSLCV